MPDFEHERVPRFDRIGILGAGGFGRETADLILSGNYQKTFEAREILFVEPNRGGLILNGVRVLTEDEFMSQGGRSGFIVAIADFRTRRKLVARMIECGLEEVDLLASTARVDRSSSIGSGAVLCDFACITANARIGKSFHGNVFSYVAHDCHVGDYVTLGPYAACLGRVVVEDDVFIGAKAVIRNGECGKPTVIGKGAKIGMGAIVLNDVKPGDVIVGNPGRSIRTER